MKTMYLSKYALSAGIKAVSVDWDDRDTSGDSRPRVKPDGYLDWYTVGKDIHHDRADAVAAAKVMAAKRIVSLRKQIAKLEAMTFE